VVWSPWPPRQSGGGDARARRAHLLEGQLVAHAALLDQVGEEDVRARSEPAHQRGPARLVERDGDRALAAVVEREGVVRGELVRVAHRAQQELAEDVAAGRLDLDHVDAEVGEQGARGGRGEPVGDFEDADPGERCGHARHEYHGPREVA
jgi:hypothetical protein